MAIKTMAPDVEQLRSAMLGLVGAANPLSAQIESATGKIRVLSQGLRASTGDAAALVAQMEGFSSKAYLDSDGTYRVGYGSDTTTNASDQVSAVTAGTTTTEEDAQRDLARRIVEFQQEAAQQIGVAWAGLSDKAKASITSVTYNYDHVPDSVTAAAQTGDDRDIAAAIRGLSANPDRRQQEANTITSPTLSGVSDPKLIAQANEALAQQKDALQAIEVSKAGGTAIDQARLSRRMANSWPQVAPMRRLRHDAEAFARALTGVYATDPSYGDKLVGLMRAHGLETFDQAVLAPSSEPSPADSAQPASAKAPPQTSAPPLSLWQRLGALFTRKA